LGVERALEDLDGDVAPDARIAGTEQGAHATLADQVEDFVAPEIRWNLHKSAGRDGSGESSLYIGRPGGPRAAAGVHAAWPSPGAAAPRATPSACGFRCAKRL